MENQNNNNNQLQIELKEEVSKGIYANLALIANSSSEFVFDFVSVLPGLPKAEVQSRIIMAPEHAKRLLYTLQANVSKYEQNFGAIQLPEQNVSESNNAEGKTFVPPMSGFKGEA